MNKHDAEDVFTGKVRKHLDEDITSLDAEVSERLAANRKSVIDNLTQTPSRKLFDFNWQQSAPFAAASLLILTASISLFTLNDASLTDVENNILLSNDYDTNDDAVIAEYELLNDLEFISWLMEEENNAG